MLEGDHDKNGPSILNLKLIEGNTCFDYILLNRTT